MDGIRVGSVIGGDIRIDARVGEGGYGVVFRGMQLRVDRRVAIKVAKLDGAQDPSEAWDLFEREAIVLGKLRHPQIIEVFTTGVHDGIPYLVMEWLDGESLDKKLKREGPFSEARALKIIEEIAKALGKAHQRSLIHRDLKPENIFEMPDSTIKLIDFGIGRQVDLSDEEGSPCDLSERSRGRQLTAYGTVRGTPHYMSPEQAAGRELDQRTDIYSCGVVLYQLLTGRTPLDEQRFAIDSFGNSRVKPIKRWPLPGTRGTASVRAGDARVSGLNQLRLRALGSHDIVALCFLHPGEYTAHEGG